MTLKLPGDIEKFIEDQVKSGAYESPREVVCAGLRLLRMRAGSSGDDFQAGEWDVLLADAEGTKPLDLEDVIAKRRAERARDRAAR